MLTRDDLIPHLRARAQVAAEAAEASDEAPAEAAAATLARTTTPLPTSAGPRRALTGDELFQTVHL